MEEIVYKNSKAEVCYDFDEINLKISNQAIDLMKQLFKSNPEHRISAEKALSSLWITRFFDMANVKVPLSL